MKNAPMLLAKGREDFEDEKGHSKSTLPDITSQAGCVDCGVNLAPPPNWPGVRMRCRQCLGWQAHRWHLERAAAALRWSRS